MNKKDFFLGLLKGLIIAYLMTFLLLALLAFFMYKCRWGEQPIDIGIAVIYVFSSSIAGFIVGGHVPAKKFLWGCFAGLIYALILVIVALIINKGVAGIADHILGPFLLCLGGGMIGGMFR